MKKFNMAEGGYLDADVFDCQVKAHQIFFEDQLPSGFKPLPKEKWPSSMPKTWTGTAYDITGFYGQQVVALLSRIVNDKEQFTKNKTFYLLIRDSSEDNSQAAFEELFRLNARPSPPNQPGNGIVFLRERGKKLFKRGLGTSYEELNGALRACYDTRDEKGKLMFSDTTSFAKDIKKLLKDNAQINKCPQPTFDAYMILLFEIARRLVKIENPSERKQAFDVLPIGSAIARLINLLEHRKSTFDEVFFANERFHCFTGRPKVRRKAIEEINEATMRKAIEEINEATMRKAIEEINEAAMNIKRATEVTVLLPIPLAKEKIEEIETNRQLQELGELFCPDKRPAAVLSEELAKLFRNLNTRIGQERASKPSRMLSTSNAERATVFDHLD